VLVSRYSVPITVSNLLTGLSGRALPLSLLVFNGSGQSLNKNIAYNFTVHSFNKYERVYMCATDDLKDYFFSWGRGEKYGPKLLQIL